MAGVTIDIDDRQVLEVLELLGRLDAGARDLTEPFTDFGEHLLNSHRERWARQESPDGTPWAPLDPKYQARKNADKILVLEGILRDTLHYEAGPGELLFGTNAPYGAIHQFGGDIPHAARSQQAYFRLDKRSGTVGNKFVKKSRSNFAQWVTIGAHTTHIPARPWLGLTDEDERELLAILGDFLVG